MAKKKKSGGRKPVEPLEKVVLVGFYTKQKNVEHFGGLSQARAFCKETLEANVELNKHMAFNRGE